MTRKRASRKEEGHWAPALTMYITNSGENM
jgi:hypothetical protein